MSDREFSTYLQYAVQISGQENRSPRELRQLILSKAEELSLPVESAKVLIQGEGQRLNVAVSYHVDTTVPLLSRGMLRREFSHKAAYRAAY